MADFYCNHGAYASNLGAVPTWGVPQEGDGASINAATAASVGSITFGAVPTTGTISVCGVSISTTGVLNAASETAAATALAANINAATTAVGSTVAIGVPQLRNLVYARSSAGLCEIMMRASSRTLNNATNSSCAVATTFDGSPTLVQFIGGTGGCFGWITNHVALGVASSIAVSAHGVMFGKPMVDHVVATEDTCYVRSGGNPTISLPNNTSLVRSIATSMKFIIDTNTRWTGDGTSGTVTFSTPMSAGVSFEPNANTGSYSETSFSVVCLRKHALVFSYTPSASAAVTLCSGNNGSYGAAKPISLTGVLFLDASASSSLLVRFMAGLLGTGGGTFYGGSVEMIDCTFRRTFTHSALGGSFFVTLSSSTIRAWFLKGCRFEYNLTGGTPPTAFINLSGGVVGNVAVRLQNCVFTGWTAGDNKFTLISALPANAVLADPLLISVIGCSGLALPSIYAGLSGPASMPSSPGITHMTPDRSGLIYQRSDAGGSFRYENQRGVLEFDADAAPAYPTYSATNLSGAPWSMRAVLIPTSLLQGSAYTVPPIIETFRAAAAIKTLTANLFMTSALAAANKPGNIEVTFAYVSNADGTVKSETTVLPPASSAAVWANAASYPTYEARKVSITTTDAIKTDTDITVTVTFVGKPATLVSELVYLDPNVVIT